MAELLAAGLLALAGAWALLRPAWLVRFERPLLAVLRRPRRAIAWTLALGALTLLAQAAACLLAGLPEPRVHDEHSLLLQADTFLQGRLANPSPARWRHFETFHVLTHPTYASKYPPAAGAALALGRLLGHPLLGVWFAGAAFVAAAAWMLHAWLPPLWARLAAVLLAANVVVGTDWSAGYRGPFVAAAAGALLLGAAERLRRRPGPMPGAVLGLALALLAASRPYEGLVLAVAALLPLLARAVRLPAWRRAALRGAAPAALLVVAGGLGWLAFYQQRVTGDPLRVPFLVYDGRHARVPLFLWQELREPAPSNPRMEAFYRQFEAEAWRRQHTPGGWLEAAAAETAATLRFYLGPALLLPLLCLPWALRSPRVRRAGWTALAVLASQLVIVPGTPRYAAPAAALLVYLAVEGWRRLRLWRRPHGRALAAALPFAALLAIPGRVADLRPEPWSWELRRARLRERLEGLGGPQLVLVAYDPRSSPHAEWVFNEADLASTPVLWARALSPAEDCALVRAMPERRAWRLEVVEDVTPPRLSPFPVAACGDQRRASAAATGAVPAAAPRSAPAAPRRATAR